MNRNQLRYFVAAAESQSFTKAAEQFYISQTAITCEELENTNAKSALVCGIS